jgi:hypothetical protein
MGRERCLTSRKGPRKRSAWLTIAASPYIAKYVASQFLCLLTKVQPISDASAPEGQNGNPTLILP